VTKFKAPGCTFAALAPVAAGAGRTIACEHLAQSFGRLHQLAAFLQMGVDSLWHALAGGVTGKVPVTGRFARARERVVV
jgi:hypothetical protein